MRYKKLEAKRVIEKYDISPEEIESVLAAAQSDLKTARALLHTDVCWAFNVAYNAILQAALAVIYSKGYRPVGEAKHVSVILFLHEALGKEHKDNIARFNHMRRKRNKAVYGILRDTTEYEAKETVKFAAEFVKTLTQYIKE